MNKGLSYHVYLIILLHDWLFISQTKVKFSCLCKKDFVDYAYDKRLYEYEALEIMLVITA